MNSIELPPQFPNACQKIRVLPELGKHFNNSANTLRLPHNNSIIASNIKRFAYKKAESQWQTKTGDGSFFRHIIQWIYNRKLLECEK